MNIQAKHFLVLAGALSFALALLHLVMIFVGAEAYRYFGAGEDMAQMSLAGSLYPIIVTLVIVVVFFAWGLYALSGAGIVKQLPLLRIALIVIASIYTLRGLAVIPQAVLVLKSSETTTLKDVAFSLVSLLAGVTYFVGTIPNWKKLKAVPLNINDGK